jgi:mono/diheme cytochrome c family protein
VNKWLKALLFVVIGLVVLLAIGITATIGWRPIIGPRARALTDRKFEPTAARLARGEYMAKAVTPCLVCHSETDPNAQWVPIPGAEGGGRVWMEPGLEWVVMPNITPDPETGAGNWSDDTIARAVREGIGYDGRALFPFMPYEKFRTMSDEDLASIISYIRTLKPIRKQQPKIQIPFPVNRLINDVPHPIEAPVPEPDRSTPQARGKYLATIGVCADCHTPFDPQNAPIAGLEFAGGTRFAIPGKKVVNSANLTPSANGIPYYTPELFIEAIRNGRVRSRDLSDVMPWRFYRNMTDEDLRDIFAYLQTLAPVDHFVDNSLPPTQCARCGQSHGGGERNKALAE